MTLWGNKDSVYSDGTIAVSGTTVTGTGTTFNTAGLINEGDVISIGAGVTQGEAVIASVTNGTTLVLKQKNGGAPIAAVPAGASYVISQKPQSLLGQTQYSATEIFGVDNDEVGVARTTAYSVTHGGWVGITSYIQNNADGSTTLRVKTETLVAMGKDKDNSGGITGDAADDAKFAE
tara:strand:- start:42 stop:572 length:531 start_codon:yes stop_codon:yes gene_type:complete